MKPAARDEDLSTGDVARLFDVSADLVRYWERTGKLAATRTPSGRRRFALKHVARFAAQRGVDVAPTRTSRG